MFLSFAGAIWFQKDFLEQTIFERDIKIINFFCGGDIYVFAKQKNDPKFQDDILVFVFVIRSF